MLPVLFWGSVQANFLLGNGGHGEQEWHLAIVQPVPKCYVSPLEASQNRCSKTKRILKKLVTGMVLTNLHWGPVVALVQHMLRGVTKTQSDDGCDIF